MLDAAEELLAQGGPDALTIDAVITRAQTSNGAFYSRFGNREGLLLAVQDRFLDRLEKHASAQATELSEIDDLNEVLARFTKGFLETFRIYRNAFNAIMIQHRSAPSFRERGSKATIHASAALTALVMNRSQQVTHPNPQLAADFAFRTLFAVATHVVMMDEGEVTGSSLDSDTWIKETTDLLYRYLTS